MSVELRTIEQARATVTIASRRVFFARGTGEFLNRVTYGLWVLSCGRSMDLHGWIYSGLQCRSIRGYPLPRASDWHRSVVGFEADQRFGTSLRFGVRVYLGRSTQRRCFGSGTCCTAAGNTTACAVVKVPSDELGDNVAPCIMMISPGVSSAGFRRSGLGMRATVATDAAPYRRLHCDISA